ncbi:MAG: glycerophosphodiester phosphodiesterase family protein [Acholeplasmataceae bacterium]|nr:glycerophosphodiester phosphodiesterase family protein [Acholeplasmataceae bacterium]MDD4194000.1 glycerophosphodiester phosphodiesterase family protein [Acholeplasmataceae bacterium]
MKDLTWLKNDLIAHRGLHSKDFSIVENSITAFKEAINHHYSIEFDINVLKDGTVIVFHDKDFKRICQKDLKLSDVTYDDIKNFRLKDTNDHIPTLKEVLELVDGKVNLLIELKPHGDNELLAKNFMEIIETYKGNYAIFSFHPGIVKWFKNNHPEIIRGQITEYFKSDNHMKPYMKYLMKTMFFNHFTKPDFISYGIHNLPNKWVDKAKEKGITVISYAARTQEQLDFVKSRYHNVVFEHFIPKEKSDS